MSGSMYNLKYYASVVIMTALIGGCGLLDRKGGDDVISDLEPIPEEPISQESAILIDDQDIEIASLTVDRDYWRDLYNGLDVDVPAVSDDVYGCSDTGGTALCGES